jgi:hypothetical protein
VQVTAGPAASDQGAAKIFDSSASSRLRLAWETISISSVPLRATSVVIAELPPRLIVLT